MPSKPGILVAITVLCAGIAHGQTAAPTDGWSEYRNEKYGVSAMYPSGLFDVERTSEAGDGQVWVTKDGDARLLVGALVNDSGFTPATYQEHVRRESYRDYKIDYRPLGGSWFVLSGEANGKTFYEKVMFSCAGRLISSFALIYPSARQPVFGPILERMEDAFRPGRDCGRAGLSQVKPNLRVTEPRQRPRFASGPRSAWADRIARERGHDVLIILRRTTPPYDRKIVRGYVSQR